jgi:asparagine synthase (glutamine-hydrolysing)
MRRLQPFDRLATSIVPDPGCDIARVCVLESSNYMRHQLLRDADWAGMAHGVEIRVPLVDVRLLKSVAPVWGNLVPGAGKAALAQASSRPLPDEVVARGKTGFAVPTGAWMARTAGSRPADAGQKPKGLVSRDWSRVVLSALTSPKAALAL